MSLICPIPVTLGQMIVKSEDCCLYNKLLPKFISLNTDTKMMEFEMREREEKECQLFTVQKEIKVSLLLNF